MEPGDTNCLSPSDMRICSADEPFLVFKPEAKKSLKDESAAGTAPKVIIFVVGCHFLWKEKPTFTSASFSHSLPPFLPSSLTLPFSPLSLWPVRHLVHSTPSAPFTAASPLSGVHGLSP